MVLCFVNKILKLEIQKNTANINFQDREADIHLEYWLNTIILHFSGFVFEMQLFKHNKSHEG